MEWKGLAARFRRIPYGIRCALTGTWNGRRVNCPGLLLGTARTPLLALVRLFALSANCLARRVRAEGRFQRMASTFLNV